jgi:lipid A 3-O-deacylase
MQKKQNAWKIRSLQGALFAGLAIASATASADTFGLMFAPGLADHGVKKADVGGVWDPGWTWWELGGWHFTVVGEAHVAYWDIQESQAAHPGLWEFGVTPVLRFIKSSGWIRPYVEAGVGPRLLSHVRETQTRTWSSSFQFADMVGVGAAFGEHQNYQAGFRFQHLSNAGIEHPNPGINFSEIYVQYNF